LKREVETNKAVYQTTLEKGKEATVAAAMSASNAHVLDPAAVPRGAYKPNLPLNLALGSIVGLFVGAAFVVVRSRLDVSIQSPGALGNQVRLQELGVIPSAKSDPEVRALTRRAYSVLLETAVKRRNSGGSILAVKGGNQRAAESLELISWTRKRSMLAEA